MKKSFCLTALAVVFTMIVACEEENEAVIVKVDDNGLSKDINDLVPESILNEMERLGMPINRGANPPIVEGTFLASPYILLSSNRPGDVPGSQFADYQVTFSGQDNDDLTVIVDYENGSETGNGAGSFIVGEGSKFSVFVEINVVSDGDATAQVVGVISGDIADVGIENCYSANFMVDDNGDPENIYIENGEGRVFYDQDGLSERL